MAERRMFAKTIIDSDAFLDMPMSARLLYYDLGMRADDDGFVNSPKKIMKIIGATNDDMNILIMRKFVIPFDTGIVVIKHWRINNYLRSDRYNPTPYISEKSKLSVDVKGKYHIIKDDGTAVGIPAVDADKNKIYISNKYKNINKTDEKEKNNKKEKKKKVEEVRHKYGEYQHVMLTDTQYQKLCKDYGEDAVLDGIKNVDEYCQQYGKSYKDYNLTLRKWGIKSPKLTKPTESKPDRFAGLDQVVELLPDGSNLAEYEADREKHKGKSIDNGYWLS